MLLNWTKKIFGFVPTLDSAGKVKKKLLFFIGPVLTFSMIYCLPVYLETYVCTRKEENIVKYIFEINFRFDKYYIFLYKNIYDNLATVLIPLLSLAWLNNKIYKLMKIRTLQIKELLERKKSNKEEEGLFQVLNVFRIYYQYIIHVTDTDCVHQSFDRNV